jgi:hypothetical protein
MLDRMRTMLTQLLALVGSGALAIAGGAWLLHRNVRAGAAFATPTRLQSTVPALRPRLPLAWVIGLVVLGLVLLACVLGILALWMTLNRWRQRTRLLPPSPPRHQPDKQELAPELRTLVQLELVRALRDLPNDPWTEPTRAAFDPPVSNAVWHDLHLEAEADDEPIWQG